MRNHDEFHDGMLEGFILSGNECRIFLTTVSKQRFTVVSDGTVAFCAGGFRRGNIIFEVIIRAADEITSADIAELYDLAPGTQGQKQLDAILAKVGAEGLELFELNPTYGGSLMFLSSSIKVRQRLDSEC